MCIRDSGKGNIRKGFHTEKGAVIYIFQTVGEGDLFKGAITGKGPIPYLFGSVFNGIFFFRLFGICRNKALSEIKFTLLFCGRKKGSVFKAFFGYIQHAFAAGNAFELCIG